jgi:hypothetical protein
MKTAPNAVGARFIIPLMKTRPGQPRPIKRATYISRHSR